MTAATEGHTGRYLVLMDEEGWTEASQLLNRVAGIEAVDSAEGGLTDPLWDADGLVMQQLGVALVSADPEQAAALTTAVEDSSIPITRLEPEREVAAITTPQEAQAAPTVDETALTWGLQAVGAQGSTLTGKGIRVAVLDTGFDVDHPDFAGRAVTTQSFVQGETVQDGHGHGTHCIGTACGPRTPAQGPGYGVAYESAVFAGKVLSNRGSGADGGILSGISWAITNGCRIVSMSLGAPTSPGQAYSRVFEEIAQRALKAGTLIIAAAGNDSRRGAGHIASTSHPANCPSILAVGALDVTGRIADFSSGTVGSVGAVDVAGPGVDVYSSWPMSTRYRRISGTSMATPHAAGVAALIAEQTQARSWELWARLMQSAKRLPLPSTDVGAGLVQAP